MSAYGASYCDAEGEADKLCVYMVKTELAWACLSDDMDMFVYGCPRVLRHASLLKHNVILYDLNIILNELNMTMSEFRQITVISGTDYNINQTTSLHETMKWFQQYKKDCISDGDHSFYNWLLKFTKYVRNYDDLIIVDNMFNIDENDSDLASYEVKSFTMNNKALQSILATDGFIFA
jgi:5'-3' exonuclease